MQETNQGIAQDADGNDHVHVEATLFEVERAGRERLVESHAAAKALVAAA